MRWGKKTIFQSQKRKEIKYLHDKWHSPNHYWWRTYHLLLLHLSLLLVLLPMVHPRKKITIQTITSKSKKRYWNCKLTKFGNAKNVTNVRIDLSQFPTVALTPDGFTPLTIPSQEIHGRSDAVGSDRVFVGSDQFIMKDVGFRWNATRIRSKTIGSTGRIGSPGFDYENNFDSICLILWKKSIIAFLWKLFCTKEEHLFLF
jgi:hypothetical protein